MAEQHTPRSLIVTFYGAYGRAPGGPVPVAELIRLLAAVGVDAPSVRSSVSRLKRRGLLVPARTRGGAAGYALSPDARQLLDDGDRRIYAHAAPRPADGWVLAVFSVPEAERQQAAPAALPARPARLRRRRRPACGSHPAALYEETRHTLERLQLAPYVDLFRGRAPGLRRDAARRWPAGGTWRRSPSSTRSSWTGTSRCCGPGRHGPATPAGGGLPGLSARPGLLAAAAVRGPGAARGTAAGGLAGRAVGGGVRGAARAAAGRGGGVRRSAGRAPGKRRSAAGPGRKSTSVTGPSLRAGTYLTRPVRGWPNPAGRGTPDVLSRCAATLRSHCPLRTETARPVLAGMAAGRKRRRRDGGFLSSGLVPDAEVTRARTRRHAGGLARSRVGDARGRARLAYGRPAASTADGGLPATAAARTYGADEDAVRRAGAARSSCGPTVPRRPSGRASAARRRSRRSLVLGIRAYTPWMVDARTASTRDGARDTAECRSALAGAAGGRRGGSRVGVFTAPRGLLVQRRRAAVRREFARRPGPSTGAAPSIATDGSVVRARPRRARPAPVTGCAK